MDGIMRKNETMDDKYINATALLGQMPEVPYKGSVRRILMQAPAADVAPVRHGRWIETTQPMGWEDVTCAECSECGEDFVLDEWGMEDMKNLMLYCPNCGALMDKEAKE